MHSIKDTIKELIGKSINAYNTQHVKDVVSELKFKEQYQGRIIDCMVGEVDDNYIITPETDSSIVKLEHSKEGVVKIPSIKGKTILVDSEGNETDTPAEGCRLVSVGEEEDNKLIILSKNKNLNSKVYWGNIYNGVFNSNTTSICSEYIRAYEGINYTSSIRDGNDVFYYVLYDLNKNYIETIPPTSRSFTAPYDCYFRCWRTKHDTNNWLQVEIDNQTLYVEPKQHKTEILLKEPLREGDYIEGKKIYRNVKQDGLTLIPLEEPIIEELPNSITLQGFDDTTMYIENTITPTVSYGYNALIPYKQELLNQKEEVETNTLDIEQNIIPYLMDMEFNLMLMEDE